MEIEEALFTLREALELADDTGALDALDAVEAELERLKDENADLDKRLDDKATELEELREETEGQRKGCHDVVLEALPYDLCLGDAMKLRDLVLEWNRSNGLLPTQAGL